MRMSTVNKKAVEMRLTDAPKVARVANKMGNSEAYHKSLAAKLRWPSHGTAGSFDVLSARMDGIRLCMRALDKMRYFQAVAVLRQTGTGRGGGEAGREEDDWTWVCVLVLVWKGRRQRVGTGG